MAITISPVSFLGFKPNTKAKHPSKEEFIQWVNQYQDTKDKDKKKQIAERVLKATEGLVVSIATALIKKSRGCELEDLIQAGRWGVFLSMMTWDRKVSEKHQSGFITHASFRIRAEIYRHCRKERRGVVASPQNKMEEKLKGNPDYQRPVEFIPWDEPYYAGTSTGDQFDVLSGEVHSHRRERLSRNQPAGEQSCVFSTIFSKKKHQRFLVGERWIPSGDSSTVKKCGILASAKDEPAKQSMLHMSNQSIRCESTCLANILS